jgi:diguanylate cyclase (GGDEF)-like protein/PAS domain S-box-containing protein
MQRILNSPTIIKTMTHQKIHQPRIVLVAEIILLVVTLLVGVTVFIIMQRHAEGLLSKSLQSSLQSRVQLTRVEIRAGFDRTVLISTSPLLIDQLQFANTRADDTAARSKLNMAARTLLQTGLTAIALYGKDGQELTRGGIFTQQPELVVPLNLPGQVQLMWDGQLLLRAVVEIKKEGRVVGKVMTEASLPAAMGALRNADHLGETEEQALCAPFGINMQCFPTMLNPKIFTPSQRSPEGVRLPMTHALEGDTGFVITHDYRHQEVAAAYAPVGDLGLGMVLKMDSAELYASVWKQLRYVIPLLLGVLAIALLLLRWLLTPLVLRLVRSEAEAVQRTAALTEEIAERKKADQRFKELLESAPDAMVIVNHDAEMVLVNSQAVILFGWLREELLGHKIEILLPKRFRGKHMRNRNDFFKQPHARAMGAGLELFGLRKDGTEFPVEVSLSPLETSEGTLVISAIRDITERKAAEARIIYLNRVYAMLSGINALIVRVQDRDELFREACRVALETGGFLMSMLCMVDRHTMKIVPVATAGKDKDKELMSSIKDRLSTSETASSTMVGLAIREKQVVVSNDSLNDPRVLFGKEYAEAGVRSMAILPLKVSDEVVGAFALYTGEIEFFQEEEIKLLTELTGDIAFAIDHLDKQEKLNYLAYYDVLTGLPSRTLFQDRLDQALTSANRHEGRLAVLLIDLDNFKNINDSLGHNAGDQLLKQLATRLANSLREGDTVARLGGDEFVSILVNVASEEDVTVVTQRILKLSAEPFTIDDHELFVTCSIGISLYPKDGEDAETLLKNADAALYSAKDKGRNNAQFCSAEMNVKALQRLTLENDLRQALKRQEFLLHYQPRVDLCSGEITGMEALVRWQHPEQGLVPPGSFIPAAEDSGLIVPLGTWVLHTACAQNKAWQAAGLKPVCVAVNLSARQFRQQDLVELVTRILRETGLDAAYLELELTESMIMHDVEATIATLTRLKAIGVKFSIDDFGTGYSSLSYLKRFPIDFLKIDQSFVRDLTTDPDDAAITKTIISMAHDLGHKVIAEGVETEEQKSFLQLHHCDEMQGYLFSRPVPAEICEAKFLALSPAE